MTTTTVGAAAFIEHKSARSALHDSPRAVGSTDDERTFTVVAAVTGIVDEVKDIILPGAFARSLTQRTPKVIADHDWSKRLGKFLDVRELWPGDPDLPKTLPNGKPWPREAGALIGRVRLFDSAEGIAAAKRWRDEGTAQQFSIGYVARKAARRKDKVRLIADLDCVEVSDVLWGAMPLCGTLPDALATKMLPLFAAKAEPEPGEPEQPEPDAAADEETDAAFADTLHRLAEPEVDWAAVDAASEHLADVRGSAKTLDMAALAAAPPYDPQVKRAFSADKRREMARDGRAMPDGSFPIDSEADLRNAIKAVGRASDKAKARRHVMKRARALNRWDLIPDDWKGQTKGWLSDVEVKAGGADRNRGNAENLRRWYVRGGGAAKIRWGTSGDFMRCVRIAGKHMTPERAKGYCNLRHQEAVGAPPGKGHKTWADHFGLAAPATLTGLQHKAADPDPDPDPDGDAERPENTGVMVALYPPPDVAEATAVDGGLPADDLHITLAYLGDGTDRTEDGTRLSEARGRIERAVATAARGHGPLSGIVGGLGQFPGQDDGVPSWVPVDVPGLSALREAIAQALDVAGTPARADHGFTPHMTLGYDLADVEPVPERDVTFDRVAVVIGDQRTDVDLAGPRQVKAATYDPALEIGADAGHARAGERKEAHLPLTGSVEETLDAVREAVTEALRERFDADRDSDDDLVWHPHVVGTWADHVIVAASTVDKPTVYYRLPYTLTEDGTVTIGEPEQVDLHAIVTPVRDVTDAAVDDLYDAALGMKAALLFAPETKAGRVLSSQNTERVRAAVEHLLAVLHAAGIEVDKPTDVPDEDPRPAAPGGGPDDSTAPSARVEGKVLIARGSDLDPAVVLARLGG